MTTLKEQAYPVDQKGKPDLRFYRDPLEHYVQLYEAFLATIRGRSGPGYEPELAFARRTHAVWGLISKGVAALPQALRMLRHPERDAREDGASILAELGADDVLVESVLQALERETAAEPRDAMILALGHMRAKAALPVLARIVRDDAADGDTQWSAVEALGKIARRSFLKQQEPLGAARAWLAKRGL